ncbi:hypothetical protein O181_046216 [Austropuccinia psidii MF-1]|uniref:Uncharacterized protein n=1 Tax=Austropuccinia psidii MF-1 TaxID=1389203 RepID=A0A9Q3HIF4_9BASI|nr:hypothetical protein [Austropuccinia psidii MF-1]
MDNKLLHPSKEILGPRKDTGTSERLDTNVFERNSITDKSLVKKPENIIRRSEERQNPSRSSQSLCKQEYASKSFKKRELTPPEQSQGKVKMEETIPSELQNTQNIKESH